METNTALTVGTIARLAGVTVRTLHHYDEIGLVSPGGRSDTGYRLYGQEDVKRLQEVLFFRELGFGLLEIKDLVGQPGYQRLASLERQRTLLVARADRLLEMIDAIDDTMDAERRGITMSEEEMLDVFGDFDPSEYEEEARDRWGNTDAYRQSAERTARYGKQEWEELGKEADDINQAFLTLMATGIAPDSAEAKAVAERHRQHISKWFYDCSRQMHIGLGQLYVTDPRFTTNINKAGEGLAEYTAAAIAANSSA